MPLLSPLRKLPPSISTNQANLFQEKRESTERDHTLTLITISEILSSNALPIETENGITMQTTTPGPAHLKLIPENPL